MQELLDQGRGDEIVRATEARALEQHYKNLLQNQKAALSQTNSTNYAAAVRLMPQLYSSVAGTAGQATTTVALPPAAPVLFWTILTQMQPQVAVMQPQGAASHTQQQTGQSAATHTQASQGIRAAQQRYAAKRAAKANTSGYPQAKKVSVHCCCTRAACKRKLIKNVI
jgi:hypothetical protein